MTKVLFFDIDGTLTDTHGGLPEIPAGAQRKMKELQERGYLLFLASGRPYAFIPEILTNFGFDGAVLCNGAHVEMNGQFIYHQPTDLKKTIDLVNHLDENNFEYIIETKRGAYLDPSFKVLEKFFISCNINEEFLIEDFNREDIIAECLKLEVSVPDEHQAKIEEIILNDLEMIQTVGTGVAMGNAVDEAKAVANYETDRIENDGIVKALKHFELI